MTSDRIKPLLSRLLKFLFHPLTPWSELDQLPARNAQRLDAENAQDRVVRKRQIDLVCREELNYLRKLPQQGSQAGSDAPASWTALERGETLGAHEQGFSLEKLDKIEAEMSQQVGAILPVAAGEREPAQAEPPTPWIAPTVTSLATPDAATAPALLIKLAGPELEDVAMGFAKGDDVGVQSQLQQLLVRDKELSAREKIWMAALLGLYQATDQQARFEVLASEFSRRHGVAIPAWLELPGAAERNRLFLSGEIQGGGDSALALLEVGRSGLTHLVVDCSGLVRIDFPSAGALLNWVAARQAEACTVEFRGVSCLVAAFFCVVGIHHYAEIVSALD